MVEPMTSSRRDFLKGLAATIAGGVVLGGGAAAVSAADPHDFALAPLKHEGASIPYDRFLVRYETRVPRKALEAFEPKFDPVSHRMVIDESWPVQQARRVMEERLDADLKEEMGEGRKIAGWRRRPQFDFEEEHDTEDIVCRITARGFFSDKDAPDLVFVDSDDIASFGEAQVRTPTRG